MNSGLLKTFMTSSYLGAHKIGDLPVRFDSPTLEQSVKKANFHASRPIDNFDDGCGSS